MLLEIEKSMTGIYVNVLCSWRRRIEQNSVDISFGPCETSLLNNKFNIRIDIGWHNSCLSTQLSNRVYLYFSDQMTSFEQKMLLACTSHRASTCQPPQETPALQQASSLILLSQPVGSTPPSLTAFVQPQK